MIRPYSTIQQSGSTCSSGSISNQYEEWTVSKHLSSPPHALPLPLNAPEDSGNYLLSVGSFILKKTSNSTVILESTVQQTPLKRKGELSSKQSV